MKSLTISTSKIAALLAFFILASAQVSAQNEGISFPQETKVYLLGAMLIFQIVLLLVIVSTIKSLTAKNGLWKALQNKKSAGVTLLLLSFTGTSFAADGLNIPYINSGNLETLLLILNGVVLLVIFLLLGTVKSLVKSIKNAAGHDDIPDPQTEKQNSFLQLLTDSVPVDREEEVMTDHDYDGIVELDNNLPPWWLAGFYITIAASVIYIFYYHVYFDGNKQKREYVAAVEAEEERMQQRRDAGLGFDEANIEVLTASNELKEGENIYQNNCVACHAADGGGGVGPNLTDEFWIHGGSIEAIYSVIKNGVTEKGMIAWQNQLSPVQMHQVASYVYQLRETPVEGKEPQGEKYKPGSEEEVEQQPEEDNATTGNEATASLK